MTLLRFTDQQSQQEQQALDGSHVSSPVWAEPSATLTTDVQQSVQLARLVSQQALQVADKAVDVAFAGRFADDVFVIVVAQPTT